MSRTCQEAHPDFCGSVTWDELAFDLFWLPLIVSGNISLVMMPVLNIIWTRNQRSPLVKLAVSYVGHVETDVVKHPFFLNTIFFVEMVLSLWFAISWVKRTYTHSVTRAENVVDQVLCCCFFVTYAANAARHKFRVLSALSPSALVTTFTVVPAFTRDPGQPSLWFSFGYLRVYNALIAYEKIEKTGVLHNVSEITRGYIVTGLRTLVLVVILVGSTFSLEVIGDPDSLKDSFVTTTMGEISVVQMTYWIFTTISTVGYGDFAPTTVLSRLFVIIAIVVGVFFFSTEIGNLMELHKLESTGKGKFKPRYGNRHVVLMGGGVREVSSVLQSFLDELYNPEHDQVGSLGWPHLSLLSAAEQPSQLKDAFDRLPKHARIRIKYFVGDPTDPADLQRLRMEEATLVVIIASLQAADPEMEDQNNILRGLAVKMAYPMANLRLMLLRPSSKSKAVRLGFRPSRCFSINEQKCGLFALSCICRGFSTMITHCLTSDASEDLKDMHFDAGDEEWLHEYRRGRKLFVSGFVIHQRYVGMEFASFAQEAIALRLIPLAVQVRGKLMLNPTRHELQANDVIFAIAPADESMAAFQEPDTDWRSAFSQHQFNAPKPVYVEDEYVNTKTDIIRQKESKFDSKGSLQSSNRQPNNPGVFAFKFGNQGDNSSPTISRDITKPILAGLELAEKDSADNLNYQLLEAKATKISQAGGHYMLVILQGNPWQQLQAFMRTLRGPHFPFHIPVLVLAASNPPAAVGQEIFEAQPRVGLKKLSGTATVNDLLEMGMERARCVMLLGGNAGQVSTHDRRMIDGTGVTMVSTIEWEMSEKGIPGIPIMLELHQQESLKFLHRFPLYEPNWTLNRAGSRGSRSLENLHSANNTHHNIKVGQHESFINHPRFASGDIFTASCLGALVARAYYTPGIVELLDALVLGVHSGQTSCPWQVAIPESMTGRTYGDLAQSFLQPPWHALCLGLYRKCFPDTGVMSRYVVTNPEPSSQLRPDDLAIVLGSAEFGQLCFDQGLVVGARGAPRATDIEEESDLDDVKLGGASVHSLGSIAENHHHYISSTLHGAEAIWPPASNAKTLRDEATVCDGIGAESPLPALPTLESEVGHLRKLYSESLSREAELQEEVKVLREAVKSLSRRPNGAPACCTPGRSGSPEPMNIY